MRLSNITSLCCFLFTLASRSLCAADKPITIKSPLPTETHEYHFDEAVFVRNMEPLVGLTIDKLNTEPLIEGSDKRKFAEDSKGMRHLNRLVWKIVAAGKFAKGSPELRKLFDDIVTHLGQLDIPAYIGFEKRQLEFLVVNTNSFVDSQGHPYPDFGLSSYPLENLVRAAQRKIQLRSGFDFGYEGPVYDE